MIQVHPAGAAIEQSMLGAAHACGNPLTARLGITHGAAVGLLLPHVVRFNSRDETIGNPYSELCDDAEELARRLEQMVAAARLPRRLRDCDVPEALLPDLAKEAAEQWTAGFNPRVVGQAELLSIYRMALG